MKKYRSSSVAKSITAKPPSNKDVNQLCFKVLRLCCRVLKGRGV